MPVFPVLGQIGVKLEENGMSWAPCGRGGRIATASLRTGRAMTGCGPWPKGVCERAVGDAGPYRRIPKGITTRGQIFLVKPIDIIGFMW